jgi:hypothetical protein
LEQRVDETGGDEGEDEKMLGPKGH